MSDKLGVGIAENVVLNNASLDDKNWLKIEFRQIQEVVYNPFEALGADNEVVEKPSEELSILLFNPKIPAKTDTKGNERTKEKIVEMIVNDINRNKAVLIHLLKGYLTKDEIKFDLYRATGLDKDNFPTRVLAEGVLDQIHKNMCTDFINAAKPFFGNEDHKFRLLLIRQSKDKHFPSFRNKYLDENPFWESMEIPKGASKVKFTEFEKKEGLNDPTPTSRSSADKPAGDNGETSAPVTAASVFG